MNHDDDDIPSLRAPATGRKSDDAFLRSVKDGVKKEKQKRSFFFFVPAVAGACAVVVALALPAEKPAVIAASTLVALAEEDDASFAFVDVDAFDDDTLLALADPDAADDTFAIPDLDGSSDRELNDVEAALDRALKL